MATLSSSDMAKELKVNASAMGTSILRSIKAVINLTSPPGVNRRTVARPGDAKYMWNNQSFHNLSSVIDYLASHDATHKTDLIKHTYEAFVNRSKPGSKRSRSSEMMNESNDPQSLGPAIRRILDTKTQSLSAYLDLLEDRDVNQVAKNALCSQDLKELIAASQTTPEIADLEAILSIQSLSPNMRAETERRLATVRSNMAGPSNQDAVFEEARAKEMARVRDLITFAKHSIMLF